MSLQTFHLPFDVPLLPVKKLTAGNLTCIYENGNLRYICSGGKEMLRLIYSAVRDEHWETAPYVISDEVIAEREAGFTVTYTAVYQLGRIHYKAAFHIEGNNNTISFSMKGAALNTFNANRIGVCILHAATECAGNKVAIEQPDGNTYTGMFPIDISPHQPFKQIRRMQWTMQDGTAAQLIVEGDVFETEDQRNWTDATYKTYSRPAELPCPYLQKEGEQMNQRITFTVAANKAATTESGQTPLADDEIKVPFPRIGYCRPKGSGRLTAAEIKLLQKLRFDHYRIALRLYSKGWQEELSGALSEAGELNTTLELVVFFHSEIATELKALIEGIQHKKQYVSSILVLHSEQRVISAELFQQVYPELKNAFPAIQTGYGTDGNFADLNRNRPQFAAYDFVSFSINPQAHASDTRTIMENLHGQEDTIRTAQTFTGNKAIHISPVMLKRQSRTDADAATAADPRLNSWFAACWTLQSIENLSGANSITFYETTGYNGIINEHAGSPASTGQSVESIITPVYKVLEAIKAFGPAWIIKQKSNNKSKNALLIENREGGRLLFTTDNFAAARES